MHCTFYWFKVIYFHSIQEDKDKKKQEVLDRKNASKQAYEEEMNSIKPAKVPPPSKVTRAEIADKLTSQGNFNLLRTYGKINNLHNLSRKCKSHKNICTRCATRRKR